MSARTPRRRGGMARAFALSVAALVAAPPTALAADRGLLPQHPRVADAQLVVPEPYGVVGRPLADTRLQDIADVRESAGPDAASPAPSDGLPDAMPDGPPDELPFDALVQHAANATSVDAALLHAIIDTESGYDPRAVSVRGAIGLMQVLPRTAQRFGVRRLEDPAENLRAGASYVRWLLSRFDGDVRLALAAYNAGEGAVLRHGRRVPPFPETQQYVRKVMAGYSRLREAGGGERPALVKPPDTAGQAGANRGGTASVASRHGSPGGPPARLASSVNASEASPKKDKAVGASESDTSRAWRLLRGLGTWLTRSPPAESARDRPAVLMPSRDRTPSAVVAPARNGGYGG